MAIPPTRTVLSRAPAPVVVPSSGSLDQRFAVLADAINRKADLNTVPSFTGIVLTAPNGTEWRVLVDVNGVLRTDPVPLR